MTDLITWLRAQLDADEQGIQVAIKTEEWGNWAQELRIVEAHRVILDALEAAQARQKAERRNYQRWIDGKPDKPVPDGPPDEVVKGLEFAARALASIYSDRDGYREDW